jgi:hypothetical protein
VFRQRDYIKDTEKSSYKIIEVIERIKNFNLSLKDKFTNFFNPARVDFVRSRALLLENLALRD